MISPLSQGADRLRSPRKCRLPRRRRQPLDQHRGGCSDCPPRRLCLL